MMRTNEAATESPADLKIYGLRHTRRGGIVDREGGRWACRLVHEGCGPEGDTELFRVVSSGRFPAGTLVACRMKQEPRKGEMGVMWVDHEPVLGTIRSDRFVAVSGVRLRLDPAMPVWRMIDVWGS